jgi:hypothetical protein
VRQTARIGEVQGAAFLLKSTEANEHVNERPDCAGVQFG